MTGVSGEASPAVSVIVPAYNAAGLLEATITDLLRQTLPDIEIVVVDDGSTDATAEVAAELAAAHPQVRSFSLPENRGVAAAREHGVRQSLGEFIWFIDADDRPEPEALDRLVAAARRDNADVVLCSARIVTTKGGFRPVIAPRLRTPVTGRQAFRMLLTGDISGHLWNKLVRREVAEVIDFPLARVHSDLAMSAQLLAGASRVTSIPDVLYSYVLRGGSIIHSGQSRADSLALIDQTVRSAAAALDPRILETPEYRYFRLRYITLSGLKDAAAGPYDERERRERVARLRPQLTWTPLLLALRKGDWRRFTLGASAKISWPLYRRLLGLAAARAGSPESTATSPRTPDDEGAPFRVTKAQ